MFCSYTNLGENKTAVKLSFRKFYGLFQHQCADLRCNRAVAVDEIFSDTNSYDKTLMEKLRLLDSLDEVEKKSIYNLVDSLISKKKLKDSLSNLIDS